MKTASATSTNPDSYEAGRELGERLASITPEVVVVFTSIHYDFAEQFAGIVDEIGQDTLVFGTTGDGFVETRTASDLGVAAIAISTDGQARFSAVVETGLKLDTAGVVARAAERLRAANPTQLQYAFVSTAIGTDGALAAAALNEHLRVPFSGGISGDDRKLKRGYVLCNGTASEDAIGLLGMFGGISASIASASGWRTVGSPAVVDASESTTVNSIGGTGALDWVSKQLGRQPQDVDLGILALIVEQNGVSVTRSIAGWDAATGAIKAFGAVPMHSSARLAIGDRPGALSGVDTAVERLKSTKQPKAALVVSCAGRKWLLGDEFTKEQIESAQRLEHSCP
ncbi:MAG: FIST N-terminal domain-containing protein [Polyangiaceae bacterium]